MALNICIEALIRLFLEIINFVFGDITLLFRGHPEALWTVVLPELLKTLVWIGLFYLIRYLVRMRLLANLIIIGIPLLLGWVSGLLAAIPIIGWLFSGAVMATAGILSAIAWGFIAITDDTVPLYLRFVGLPGMIVLGFISGVWGPLGILINVGAIIAISTISRIMIPLSTLIVLLLTLWSPTWFCEIMNSSLKVLENVRQEGVIGGISESLIAIPILIKNRLIKIKNKG